MGVLSSIRQNLGNINDQKSLYQMYQKKSLLLYFSQHVVFLAAAAAAGDA